MDTNFIAIKLACWPSLSQGSCISFHGGLIITQINQLLKSLKLLWCLPHTPTWPSLRTLVTSSPERTLGVPFYSILQTAGLPQQLIFETFSWSSWYQNGSMVIFYVLWSLNKASSNVLGRTKMRFLGLWTNFYTWEASLAISSWLYPCLCNRRYRLPSSLPHESHGLLTHHLHWHC